MRSMAASRRMLIGMRVLVLLLASFLLSGCALLGTVFSAGSISFEDQGFKVICTMPPQPISSGVHTFDTRACTQVAEARARIFLDQHQGATVESVTVDPAGDTTICYTLAGQSACTAASP